MKKSRAASVPGKRPSFSEQEIFAAIEQFEQAGNISIKEFAAAFQVSKATFYNWRKRYRTKDTSPISAAGFIPVDLSEVSVAESQGRIFAEFRGIIFYQWVEASYLKSLL